MRVSKRIIIDDSPMWGYGPSGPLMIEVEVYDEKRAGMAAGYLDDEEGRECSPWIDLNREQVAELIALLSSMFEE